MRKSFFFVLFFLLLGWWITGAGYPKRLWSLHPWRHSKPGRTRHWANFSWLWLNRGQVTWSLEVPSKLISPMINELRSAPFLQESPADHFHDCVWSYLPCLMIEDGVMSVLTKEGKQGTMFQNWQVLTSSLIVILILILLLLNCP